MNAEQRNNELSNLEAKKAELEHTIKERDKDAGAKPLLERKRLELEGVKKRIKELTPATK